MLYDNDVSVRAHLSRLVFASYNDCASTFYSYVAHCNFPMASIMLNYILLNKVAAK